MAKQMDSEHGESRIRRRKVKATGLKAKNMASPKMAGAAGLEPVTSAVTGQRSNQLSYTPAKGFKRVGNPLPRVNGEVDKSR